MSPDHDAWTRNRLKGLDEQIDKTLADDQGDDQGGDDDDDGIDLVNDPLFSPEAEAERGFPPRPSAD